MFSYNIYLMDKRSYEKLFKLFFKKRRNLKILLYGHIPFIL